MGSDIFFALVILGVPTAIMVGVVMAQSKVARTRNGVEESLASVDAHLQKRHDLIPNMVAVARRYMEHEENLLTRLTELRASASAAYNRRNPKDVATHLAAESALRNEMQSFVTAIENYPDLRSADSMAQLMQSLNSVEANIAAARRFYNQSVSAFRNTIQTFPGFLIARYMSLESYPYFEAAEIARAPVDVSAQLTRRTP